MEITGKKNIQSKLSDYKEVMFIFDYMKKDRIVYVGIQGSIFLILSFKTSEDPYYIYKMTLDQMSSIVDEDTKLFIRNNKNNKI